MRIKYALLVSCLCFIAISSCKPKDPNKQIDEGKIAGEAYKSDEIGWTMLIPKGWTITSRDQMEANEEKGLKAIEKSTGTAISTKGLKHLIAFQKDKFNSFGTTSQPVKEESDDEYQASVQELYKIIYNTFSQQGIKVDTSSRVETIGGKQFFVFYDRLYSSKGEVILNQLLYSRIINGYDFAVNINYNSDENKEVLLKAFKSSTFK